MPCLRWSSYAVMVPQFLLGESWAQPKPPGSLNVEVVQVSVVPRLTSLMNLSHWVLWLAWVMALQHGNFLLSLTCLVAGWHFAHIVTPGSLVKGGARFIKPMNLRCREVKELVQAHGLEGVGLGLQVWEPVLLVV